MSLYNPISCSGFISETTGFVASGSCMKSRIGFVLLFFIIAILRKWGGEELGVSFSFAFALIGGLLPYLIVIVLFGSFKIALVIGIVGGVVGGYGGGLLFEGGEEY